MNSNYTKHIQFSHSFVYHSLQPHESQHARPLCPSPTPGVYSNSCPSSRWCHPAISSSVVPFSCPQSLPASEYFPMSRLLHQVPKVLDFQLQHQPFEQIFRTDFLEYWLVWSPCSPRDSQESSPAPQFKTISCLAPSLLDGPTFTSIHDYWKNHSFDYTNLCQQSNVSTF